MADQRKTWQSQDISGRSVGIFHPVMGTPARPSLGNSNLNTPNWMFIIIFNPVSISVLARASNDATPEHVHQNIMKKTIMMMWKVGLVLRQIRCIQMSPNYIHNRECEPMHRVISYPKSNSKPYRRSKQNINSFGFPTGENSIVF